MRLTFAGKVLLAAIVVAAGYGLVRARGHAIRVDHLAHMSDCDLAADYFGWRMSFESEIAADQKSITGKQLDKFMTASRLYRDALARRAAGLAPFLVKLQKAVEQDADKTNDTVAPIGSALDGFLIQCPGQATDLIATTKPTSD